MNNLETINRYIINQVKADKMDESMAADILKKLNQEKKAVKKKDKSIAIVGMACRFPKVNSKEAFWNALLQEENCIDRFPNQRRSVTDPFVKLPNDQSDPYMKAGYLDDIDFFDTDFFQILKGEAVCMDPIQRLFLEIAYQAAEDAGYGGKRLNYTNTGVYAGTDHAQKSVQYMNIIEDVDMVGLTGSWPGLLATRVSYALNLKGPAMVIDTACSSGLVAVHTACKAIQSGECDMAIAGGGNVTVFPVRSGQMSEVEASDNQVQAFDKHANGTLWGEGVAAVVLKSFEQAVRDGDQIYAVIKGSAINNDGFSNGITAPNAKAQEEVIVKAWKDAQIEPETLQYIEAHGTGTLLGDPIEIKGITNAFRKYTSKKQFCAIGSAKNNFGHTIAASGMASLFKVVLSLKKKKMLPTIHFQYPNPYIDFCNSPVYLNDQVKSWPGDQVRRAGVTALGFSGTNCHMVLEEYQVPETKIKGLSTEYLYTVSARSLEELSAYLKMVREFLLEKEVALGAFCYTSGVAKAHFAYRIACPVKSQQELLGKIDSLLANGIQKYKMRGIYFGNCQDEKQENTNDYEVRNRIEEACVEYCKGASLDWNSYFAEADRKKVSVPLYPFRKTSVWYEKDSELPGHMPAAVSLAGEQTVKSLDEDIYVKEWSEDSHWIAKEHKIFQRGVVPGAALLEIVLEAYKQSFGTERVVLEQVYFLKPFVLEPSITTVHAIIRKNQKTFCVAGTKNDGKWNVYVEGKWKEPEQRVPEFYDMKALFQEAGERVAYQYDGENPNIRFGRHWDVVDWVNIGEKKFVLELKPVKRGAYEVCPPALLDCALNAIIRRVGEAFYVPISCEALTLYQKPPEKWYSIIKYENEINYNCEAADIDIDLADESGKVFASFHHYGVKKVNKREAFEIESSREELFYQTKWVEYPVILEPSMVPEKVMMVLRDASIAETIGEELKRRGSTLVEVVTGDTFEQVDQTHYKTDGNMESYQQIIETVAPDMILYLNGFSMEEGNSDQIKNDWTRQSLLYDFVCLGQALQASRQRAELDVVVRNASCVEENETIANPFNSSLLGAGNALRAEGIASCYKAIDVDDKTPVGTIVKELICRKEERCNVAYRQGVRYLECLEPQKVRKKPDFCARKNGVYLITGGLGGIGLEVCKFLAASEKVILCLVTRKLPFTEDELLEEKAGMVSETYKTAKEVLKAIEASGSEVHLFEADVSSFSQMSAVIAQIHKCYRKVNGVVHAAGNASASLFQNTGREELARVLLPKTEGTIHLYELLKQDKLDFFLTCSSALVFQSVYGQAGYLAANYFLDAYAKYVVQQQGTMTAVRWPAWKDTGMAHKAGITKGDGLFHSICVERAVELFPYLFTTEESNVTVGELDLDCASDNEKRLSVILSEEIRTASKEPVYEEENSKLQDLYVDLTDYTEIEKFLSLVWKHVLKIDQIESDTVSYDLGVDSILAIRIVNTINGYLENPITITDFFNHPSIAAMSHYLLDRGKSGTRKEHKKQNIACEVAYPLSSMQERIWFLQKLNPGMVAYNLSDVSYLSMQVDREKLDEALKILAERNSMLRAVFVEEDGVPKQIIKETCEIKAVWEDLKAEQNKEACLQEQIKEENQTPFDFGKQLIRVRVYELEEHLIALYISIHHLITDGWSMDLFTRQLFEVYENLVQGRPVDKTEHEISYVEWIQKTKEFEKSETYQQTEAYWKKEFQKPVLPLELPLDFERPEIQTFHGSYVTFQLKKETTDHIKQAAKRMNCTVQMLMLSAYFLFLKKLTQTEELVVGIPHTGRDSVELEKVMGLFVNTLCIRINFNEIQNLKELITQVRQKCLDAYTYSRYPFDRLVADTQVTRDLSRNPMISTMFQYYEKIPSAIEGIALYDFSILSREQDGIITGRAEYNTDLLKEKTAKRYLDCFLTILKQMDLPETTALSDIRLLSDEETKKVVVQFNRTAVPYDSCATIQQVFQKQVQKVPEKTAVECGMEHMTYKELDRYSNAFANRLLKHSFHTEDIVGIALNRGISVLVAILGTLKAGGMFLPIDKRLPKERIQYMLDDSKARFLVIDEELGLDFSGYQIRLEEENASRVLDEKAICVECQSKNAAYLLYTSGSTGKPKGVVVEHKNVVNFVSGMDLAVGFHRNDRILSTTTISFDIFMLEMVLPLLLGMTTIICTEDELKDATGIGTAIRQHRVSVVQATPSRLRILLQREETCADLQRIQKLLIGGEKFPTECLDRLKELGVPEIYNMYGPTETTIWSSVKKITGSKEVTIGKPIANTQMYILGEEQAVLPIGVKGQLFIAGDGVARGYFGREQLTKEKFKENPFQKGTVMYQTGDMAKWLENGEIELCGRQDNQIKVRGYRVELEEIEAVIQKNTPVEACAVTYQENGDGVGVLAAYYTAKEALSVTFMRNALRKNLPDYMIPDYYVYLPDMPYTANQKIERKNLPELTYERPKQESEYQKPHDEVQEYLQNLWTELLKVKEIGIYDNFFDLGGNSFQINILASRLDKKYPGKVSVMDLFKYPNICQLSEYIKQGKKKETSRSKEADDKIRNLLESFQEGGIDLEDVVQDLNDMEV